MISVMIHSGVTTFFRVIRVLGLTAVMSPAMADTAPPASLLDSWSGSFQVGNYPSLELVFHFSREDSGALAVELDVPSQYRSGIPAERVTLNDRRLTLYFPDIEAEFLGAVSVNEQSGEVERISGDWSQSGEFVALTLQRHETDD